MIALDRFLLVNSIGAGPRAASFYLRTKGEAEDAVARLGYTQVTILRPSFLDDDGARREYRPGAAAITQRRRSRSGR